MKKEFMKRVMAAGMVAAMALQQQLVEVPQTTAQAQTKQRHQPRMQHLQQKQQLPEDDGSYDECTLTISWWGGDSRHTATQAAVDAFMKAYPESQLRQPIPHGMDGKRKWQLLLQQEPHRM